MEQRLQGNPSEGALPPIGGEVAQRERLEAFALTYRRVGFVKFSAADFVATSRVFAATELLDSHNPCAGRDQTRGVLALTDPPLSDSYSGVPEFRGRVQTADLESLLGPILGDGGSRIGHMLLNVYRPGSFLVPHTDGQYNSELLGSLLLKLSDPGDACLSITGRDGANYRPYLARGDSLLLAPDVLHEVGDVQVLRRTLAIEFLRRTR